MKQLIKDYFSFSKGERNGLIVMLLTLFTLLIYEQFELPSKSKSDIDFSSLEKKINEFYALRDTSNSIDNKELPEIKPFEKDQLFQKEEKLPLFAFNPNNLTSMDWQKLGLSEKQILIIRNYERKGGKFYKKDDLKKIFGISPALFKRLEPYIEIPEQESKKPEILTEKPIIKAAPEVLLVDINLADADELRNIKGIGAVFASRIIDFRDALGGLVNIEQLKEVYGLDSTKYNQIAPFVRISGSNVRKININYASYAELNRHPYISQNVARSLINYRDRHGLYENVEAIKRTALVNEDLFRKIVPYLTK